MLRLHTVTAIGAEARAALYGYFVHERGKYLGSGFAAGPLFVARGGRRMSPNAMEQVLDDLRRLAQTDITSHQFRRYTAARLLREGAHLDTVMGQLGHEGPQMSLTYGRKGRDERNIREFHAIDAGLRRIRR